MGGGFIISPILHDLKGEKKRETTKEHNGAMQEIGWQAIGTNVAIANLDFSR